MGQIARRALVGVFDDDRLVGLQGSGPDSLVFAPAMGPAMSPGQVSANAIRSALAGLATLGGPMYKGFVPANVGPLIGWAKRAAYGTATKRQRLVCLGSSVVHGNDVPDQSLTWPRRLGAKVGQAWGRVNNATMCGHTAFVPDLRVTYFGASYDMTVGTIGGLYLRVNTPGGGYSFAPGVAFDALTVTHAAFPNAGTYTVEVDGVQVANVAMSAATDKVGVTEITGLKGKGSSVVKITGTSTGTGGCFLGACICRKSDGSSGVEIYNSGMSGLFTADMVETGQRWAYGGAWQDYFNATDSDNLFVIEPGTLNDALGTPNPFIDLATSVNNFAATLVKAKARGAVLTFIPGPISLAADNAGQTIDPVRWATYADAHINASLAAGVPVIDNRQEGTFASMAVNMLNSIHPYVGGYEVQAGRVFAALVKAAE